MRKWDNVTQADLLTAFESLKHSHSPDTARNLIEYFHERMQDEDFYDSEILHLWMKHVFAQIIAGKSADQAFGLKGVKGQHNRPDTFSRDICIAAMVVRRRRQKDEQEKYITWENAVTDVAQGAGLGDRSVERAYEAFRDGLECLTNEQLEQIIEGALPPPQPHL